MPNGGTDNCFTCSFNRRNEGKLGHARGNPELPHHCLIRDQALEDPGYRYCLNHPYRTDHEPDPIPVGPLLKAEAGPGYAFDRVPWKPSPDSEEIRLHLLDLLSRAEEVFAKDFHPAFGQSVRFQPDYIGVVIWQLGEFGERRAVPGIERVRAGIPELAGIAGEAIESIREKNEPGTASRGDGRPHRRSLGSARAP